MESWMVSLFLAVAGVVSTFSVLKTNVSRLNDIIKELEGKIQTLEKAINENSPVINHLSKTEDIIGAKVEAHSINITGLKEKVDQTPRMKDIRAEFVSKELFLRTEKGVEDKFDAVNNTLNKILDKLEENR